jgi:P-type Cu2+ transporter
MTESMVAGASQAAHGAAAPAGASHHEHDAHAAQSEHGGHGGAAGHVDHTGHEIMFRNRFWVCLLLSIPVLLYSPMLQMWFGFEMPTFPGSNWISPIFSLVVFLYGGVPFLQMAVPEIRSRKPGMMTLISLAITVAFVYRVAAIWIDPHGGFFWEMVLLIDVMLLGHSSCRSVRLWWQSTRNSCAVCHLQSQRSHAFLLFHSSCGLWGVLCLVTP